MRYPFRFFLAFLAIGLIVYSWPYWQAVYLASK